jgi:hypothetical protein
MEEHISFTRSHNRDHAGGFIIMNCEDRRRKMSSVTQGAVPEMTYGGIRIISLCPGYEIVAL